MIGRRPCVYACAYVDLVFTSTGQSCDRTISTRSTNIFVLLVLIHMLMSLVFSLAYTCAYAYAYANASACQCLCLCHSEYQWSYSPVKSYSTHSASNMSPTPSSLSKRACDRREANWRKKLRQ